MNSIEKQISYTATNSYSSLNELTPQTRNIWFVLHGIGYLSRYFLKYFSELPPEENYIIAPQAPSKYYLNGAYTHVGASWLTRERTSEEIENVIRYLDQVYAAETPPEHCKLIIFGYSQGVSIATRWAAKRKLLCDHLFLHSGGIPEELEEKDLEYLKECGTDIRIIVGDKDQYLTEERRESESKKIERLFQGRAKHLIFEGKHEIKKTIINTLI